MHGRVAYLSSELCKSSTWAWSAVCFMSGAPRTFVWSGSSRPSLPSNVDSTPESGIVDEGAGLSGANGTKDGGAVRSGKSSLVGVEARLSLSCWQGARLWYIQREGWLRRFDWPVA